MELRALSKEEYIKFINQQRNVDFLQSSYAADKLIDEGWNVEFIQGIDQDKIKACAMVCTTHLLRYYYYAYVPRGFFIDYSDSKTLADFVSTLRSYLKKKKVIYLEIDPNIIYHQRDKNGAIVKDGLNNQIIIDNLIAAGFLQMPNVQGYDTNHQCRWMSVIDLRNKDAETIFSEFSTQTRNDIRNAQKFGVKIRELSIDELPLLDHMEQEAGERHHFETKSISYYQTMAKHYGPEHLKTLYAYLDLEAYTDTVLKERKKTQAEVEELQEFLEKVPNSKKKQRRLKAAQEYYEGLLRKEENIENLKTQFGNELPLAASMFIKFGRQIVYLFSGSDYKYRIYRGPYAIQWHMIQEAIYEGYDFYNMYGISGYFEKGQDGYGVFDFKRGFNAQVVELIGRYHLVIHPILYKLHKKIHKAI